jgi:hypothetical protein
MGKAAVEIGPGTFPAGAVLGLHERVGDARSGRASRRSTVSKEGTASFGGLEPGAQFYIVGDDTEGREIVVAATAKVAGQPAPRVARDPDQVRADLRTAAADQGSTNAAPVEGMRSTATAKPARQGAQTQADINRETAESSIRTEKALAKQDVGELDSVDASALAVAKGVDPGLSGASGVETLASLDEAPAEPTGAEKRVATGLTAAQRSERSRKAAATRRRNAGKKKSGKK